MASTIKQKADAKMLARHIEADLIRDRAEQWEADVTAHMIKCLGGDSIWGRAAKGGIIPLK